MNSRENMNSPARLNSLELGKENAKLTLTCGTFHGEDFYGCQGCYSEDKPYCNANESDLCFIQNKSIRQLDVEISPLDPTEELWKFKDEGNEVPKVMTATRDAVTQTSQSILGSMVDACVQTSQEITKEAKSEDIQPRCSMQGDENIFCEEQVVPEVKSNSLPLHSPSKFRRIGLSKRARLNPLHGFRL